MPFDVLGRTRATLVCFSVFQKLGGFRPGTFLERDGKSSKTYRAGD